MLEARFVVRKRFVTADRRIVRHMGQNALSTARELRDFIRGNLSVRGFVATPPRGKRLRGGRRINVRHSRPGDFPYEQTGDLKASFSAFLDRFSRRPLTAYVASDSDHMLPLEFGAPAIHLAPRPHVRRTLIQRQRELARIFLRPL